MRRMKARETWARPDMNRSMLASTPGLEWLRTALSISTVGYHNIYLYLKSLP
jgi:hypothetical protein